mmetsp:Transcript_7793/g.18837  ORF Transcript_7793/g.18837 Transcript_7793/m.18837 type:complete len:336 (+) Transcript_7793:466-1473(+)
MVTLLDNDGVSALQRQLSHVDVGDRILSGRVQLFTIGRGHQHHQDPAHSCASSSSSSATSHSLPFNKLSAEQIHDFRNASPLGPMSQQANKNLLAILVQVLGLAFPEYDYSTVTPDRFEELEHDAFQVMNEINGQCFSLAERWRPGFMELFWRTVRECIEFNKCTIYSYKPESVEEIPGTPLFSFFYFFTDAREKKLLFLFGSTRSKYCGVHNSDLSDGEAGCDSSDQSGMLSDGSISIQSSPNSGRGPGGVEGDYGFDYMSDDSMGGLETVQEDPPLPLAQLMPSATASGGGLGHGGGDGSLGFLHPTTSNSGAGGGGQHQSHLAGEKKARTLR